MSIKFRSAYLVVFYGPMCSGKTGKCRERLSEFNDIGLNCCYINHSKDTRGGADISSTNSTSTSKLSPDITQIKSSILANVDTSKFQVIAIDEAQFYDDLLISVEKWLKDNKIIIVSGLKGNYRNKKFGNVLDLLPLADDSEDLKAYCKACINGDFLNTCKEVTSAPFTIRLTNEQTETVIGGTDLYAPVCRYHHNLINNMTDDEKDNVFKILRL